MRYGEREIKMKIASLGMEEQPPTG